ncbi:MAG: cryptochrome/photolyase family protein [Rubrivivax sp.]|nr:cryptochrome/photolyase family protein [Rubrivivax sp.]
MQSPAALRHLVVVLGDQLDRSSAAFDGFDAAQDRVWMCEAVEESTQVWSAKQRIAVFLAAMRHFAAALRAEGLPLEYRRLDDEPAAATLGDALREALAAARPQRVLLVEPGEFRVREALRAACAASGVALELREDRHFLCSTREFAAHARGRRQLRMEYFYREMRRRHDVLMDDGPEGRQPAGGQWNYDADNRESFGRDGPGLVPPPLRFAPDEITREVLDLVARRFADHPGRLEHFGWPLTRAQALAALDDFVEHRLQHFGRWQDAMWAGQPWLWHSTLAVALNLKLLHPREVVAAAEQAWCRDPRRWPLATVEGFVRQILGWREYVRGVYWLHMPQYAELNELGATHDLPAWYWTGDTAFVCLRDAIRQTLDHGYAHHIQRLMVNGLFALLYGVRPQQVHAWYLAVYVDAVEWVELPNTLGMSQFADGGVMASKPYAATGQYIARMGNHCAGCRFDPKQRSGERACPFTTLYWDFLARRAARLAANPRMALQVKNLARLDADERRAIAARADAVRRGEVGAP